MGLRALHQILDTDHDCSIDERYKNRDWVVLLDSLAMMDSSRWEMRTERELLLLFNDGVGVGGLITTTIIMTCTRARKTRTCFNMRFMHIRIFNSASYDDDGDIIVAATLELGNCITANRF